MALIKCPVCSSLISELEITCPNCEFQLTEEIIKEIKDSLKAEKEETMKVKSGHPGISAWMAYR